MSRPFPRFHPRLSWSPLRAPPSSAALVVSRSRGEATRLAVTSTSFRTRRTRASHDRRVTGVRQNFNPFTATVTDRTVRARRHLRRPHGLAEGGKADAAVARSHVEVEQRQQDLTLQLARGQVVGRQVAHLDRRRLQPTAGRQNKVMDVVGLTRRDEILSVNKGRVRSRDQPEEAGTRSSSRDAERRVRDPSHLVEVATPRRYEPEPGRLRPVTRITRFTSQDYVLSKNKSTGRRGSR